MMGVLALLAVGCDGQPLAVGDAPEAQFAKAAGCTTIQSGTLKASDGSVIPLGFDQWGYNYQANLFNGLYCDADRGAGDALLCEPYRDVALAMKWNDAWLSKTDCDGDGLLDRHFGFLSYIGSGAWLTNHLSGSYDLGGKTIKWTYFTKIVAAPADAALVGGVWYAADGSEIGPAIWGAFATIQEVYNDPGAGDHGSAYHSPVGPGFGKFKP
jgi:hypothetical protein